MNAVDILLIILIAAAFISAVVFCIINRKRGKNCCGNCDGCNGCCNAGNKNKKKTDKGK